MVLPDANSRPWYALSDSDVVEIVILEVRIESINDFAR